MAQSPYTGQRVLSRFEYVTDDGVYLYGFLIDDLSILEIGFEDGAERDTGWYAACFARVATTLPQYYAVQVIEETAEGMVTRRELTLDVKRIGDYLLEGFGDELVSAAIVVLPITLGTHIPTCFSIDVSRP